MGMTIGEAIYHLDTWSTTHGSGITTDEQHEQAKKIARDTMRKYQKIEEIVEAWKADVDIDSYDCMVEIEEVVEDGKID